MSITWNTGLAAERARHNLKLQKKTAAGPKPQAASGKLQAASDKPQASSGKRHEKDIIK